MENIIKHLTVATVGKEHDSIECPSCNSQSKPHGLATRIGDKIQLIRSCRRCNLCWWYWIDLESALLPFRED